jgi:hypothetical protein
MNPAGQSHASFGGKAESECDQIDKTKAGVIYVHAPTWALRA